MDFSSLQNKKIYEFILSSTSPSQDLKAAIQSILRRSMQQPSHFQFLLHRINWFSEPYVSYLDQLQRVIRLYRGKGKEAAKVAYNLLIQILSIQQSNKLAISCLINLVEEAFNQDIIVQCLKQNYPYKLCPLSMHEAYLDSMITFCKRFPKHRYELLQIIIENMANFDTELLIGDAHSKHHFPQDQKIKGLRQTVLSEIAQKYDILLRKLLEYFQSEEKDEDLLKSMFQIFQNKILPIKSTKLIQFVVYYLAESDKSMSSKFSSLLLANILDSDIEKENWYRIFTQSNFYLVSYIMRSNKISLNKITQIVNIMATYLIEKLQSTETRQVDERLKLKETFFFNQRNLHILQSILIICAYQPLIKERVGQKYRQLIQLAKQKMHFHYFIHEQLLLYMGLNDQGTSQREGTHRITLKYSNKFNPVILPKVGAMIDPLFKWRSVGVKSYKTEGGRKMLKKFNNEEITFCQASDTGPSNVASQNQVKAII